MTLAESESQMTDHEISPEEIFYFPKILKNDETVDSDESGECADCGREGYVSDWPGHDVSNAGVTVLVLCASAHGGGELVCDDCEENRDDAADEMAAR